MIGEVDHRADALSYRRAAERILLADWDTLVEQPQFELLDVVQTVERGSGTRYRTTVCPIRIDGQKPTSTLGSNALGEHNARIDDTFHLR